MREPDVSGGFPFWYFLRRWFWLLTVGLFVGAGLGYLVNQVWGIKQVTNFESSAILETRYNLSPLGEILLGSGELSRESQIVTLSIKSMDVLADLAERLPREWDMNTDTFVKMVDEKKLQVVAGLPGQPSTTITITAWHPDPEHSQRIVSELAKVLVVRSQDKLQQRIQQLQRKAALEIDKLEKSLAQAIGEQTKIVKERLDQVPVSQGGLPQVDGILASALREDLPLLTTLFRDFPREGSVEAASRLEELVAEYEASLREAAGTLATLNQSVDFKIGDVKVSALQLGFQRELDRLARSRVNWARLEPPLLIVEEATIVKPIPLRLRKRELMGLGGGGGLLLAWILAGFLDSVGMPARQAPSREDKGGQKMRTPLRAPHTTKPGNPTPLK